jgi:hypothetical protein
MAFKTGIDGRIEKRLPIAIVVHVAYREGQLLHDEELTYTDNVSTHGARMISSRPGKLAKSHR